MIVSHTDGTGTGRKSQIDIQIVGLGTPLLASLIGISIC